MLNHRNFCIQCRTDQQSQFLSVDPQLYLKRGRFEEFQAADVSINETKCFRISFEAFSGNSSNELSPFHEISSRKLMSRTVFVKKSKRSYVYFELKLILFFRHCSKYILVFRSGPNLLNIFHRVLVHSDSNDEYKTELDSDCKCHFF